MGRAALCVAHRGQHARAPLQGVGGYRDDVGLDAGCHGSGGGALGAPLYGLPLKHRRSSPRPSHHFSLRLKQVSAAHVGFMAKEMVIG